MFVIDITIAEIYQKKPTYVNNSYQIPSSHKTSLPERLTQYVNI